MNPELDRLLELEHKKWVRLGLDSKEREEFKSLKSQIESKLTSYDFHIRHSKAMQELITNQNQELSQLRSIVQALEEFK